MRSKITTAPAAKIPEIRAINKIWRAETLYIKVCLSKFLKSGKRWLTSLLGCSQNGRRCERLYQRRTAAASFIRRSRRINLRANPCNCWTKILADEVSEVTKNDDWRLPAQGHTAGRDVYEHEYDVNAEHEVETTFRDWQVSTAIENVSSEGADGEFCAEKSQVAVLHDAGHESITFGGDAQTNPENG